MSTARFREAVPAQYGIVALTVLIVSVFYAFLMGDLLLWAQMVLATVSLGISLFVVYLFYRLVLAIERISYKL